MSNYQTAEALIQSHPAKVFDDIASRGYSLRWSYSPRLIVAAVKHGVSVGNARFIDAGEVGYCENVHVDKDHRESGLATAMYLLATRIYKKRLLNFSSDKQNLQTDAAKRLWVTLLRDYPNDFWDLEDYKQHALARLEARIAEKSI